MPDEWHREQEQIPLSSRAARCGGFFGDTGPEDQGRKPSPSLIFPFGGIHTWTMTLHWVSSSYLFPKQVWWSFPSFPSRGTYLLSWRRRTFPFPQRRLRRLRLKGCSFAVVGSESAVGLLRLLVVVFSCCVHLGSPRTRVRVILRKIIRRGTKIIRDSREEKCRKRKTKKICKRRKKNSQKERKYARRQRRGRTMRPTRQPCKRRACGLCRHSRDRRGPPCYSRSRVCSSSRSCEGAETTTNRTTSQTSTKGEREGGFATERSAERWRSFLTNRFPPSTKRKSVRVSARRRRRKGPRPRRGKAFRRAGGRRRRRRRRRQRQATSSRRRLFSPQYRTSESAESRRRRRTSRTCTEPPRRKASLFA